MKRRWTPALAAWWNSPRFRAMGRKNFEKINAERKDGPRCGARKKSTGEPCGNWPMENGRCRLHGGRSPKGKEWHRLQPSSSNDVGRASAKIQTVTRRLRRRQKKQAAMTPDELAAHQRWHAAHQPGDPAAREARRRRIAHAQAARASIEAGLSKAKVANSRIAALDAELAELQRQLDARQFYEGVFA